jgi:pSer/pThr/pTyr-binding forkhead associated (FHA) protein
MNKLSFLSDDALSALIRDSATESRKSPVSTERVFERSRIFKELYSSLSVKPDGSALLYKESGAGCAQFSLVGEKLLVGRSEGCDLFLDDEEMSREHFAIVFSNGAYVLRDVSSSNGTQINDDKRVRERPLQLGDIIRAGRTVFAFFERMHPEHVGS